MQALQDLVAQCLQTDAKSRPSACKILKHKFFKVRRNSPGLPEVKVNLSIELGVSATRRRCSKKCGGVSSGTGDLCRADPGPLSMSRVWAS